jgi:hypothetical protein
MTNAKNLPPGMPKIWGWGAAPEGEGELLCGGGPTEDDLAELFKAVHGYPSLYGPPSQWLADQEGRVSMPFRLFIMLQKLVDWNIKQLPWTQERKDWLRAAYVFEEREKGKTMEEACAAVAKRLADELAANSMKSLSVSRRRIFRRRARVGSTILSVSQSSAAKGPGKFADTSILKQYGNAEGVNRTWSIKCDVLPLIQFLDKLSGGSTSES